MAPKWLTSRTTSAQVDPAESLVVLIPNKVTWTQPTRSPLDLIWKSQTVCVARRLRYLGIVTTVPWFHITRCLVRGSSPRFDTSALGLGYLPELYRSQNNRHTRAPTSSWDGKIPSHPCASPRTSLRKWAMRHDLRPAAGHVYIPRVSAQPLLSFLLSSRAIVNNPLHILTSSEQFARCHLGTVNVQSCSAAILASCCEESIPERMVSSW